MKTDTNSRATAVEATDKDFERMIQMLTGFFVTQIARAVATYSVADHLAKGSATAEQIATLEGIDSMATFRFASLAGVLDAGRVLIDQTGAALRKAFEPRIRSR
jgi:hypothetical protein